MPRSEKGNSSLKACLDSLIVESYAFPAFIIIPNTMGFNIPSGEPKSESFEELGNRLNAVAQEIKKLGTGGIDITISDLPKLKALLADARSLSEQLKQHPDAAKSPAHGQLVAMLKPTLDEYDRVVQQIEQQKN